MNNALTDWKNVAGTSNDVKGRIRSTSSFVKTLMLDPACSKASQKTGNHGRTIADFQNYLNEYPKGADRTAARFGLGEAQLAAGQPLPARLTWTDLARDLEKTDTKEAADTRARALYGIAKTYGIPSPPDDAQI